MWTVKDEPHRLCAHHTPCSDGAEDLGPRPNPTPLQR